MVCDKRFLVVLENAKVRHNRMIGIKTGTRVATRIHGHARRHLLADMFVVVTVIV